MDNYSFVYMADKGFLLPLAVSLCSLIRNKTKDSYYTIHLILDKVDSELSMPFNDMSCNDVSIVIHDIEGDFCEEISRKIKNPAIKVTRTDMLKFELPNYLVSEDVVLYLDCDLIINRCIEELFDVELDGMYLAAVNDMGDTYDDKGRSVCARRIGLEENEYFNAGMMLLNLKEMRLDGVPDRLWDYRKNGINYFMSQDALNTVTLGKRVILDNKYNFITAVIDEYTSDEIYNKYCHKKYNNMGECLDDQSIIHMAGTMKPWVYHMPWVTERFLEYYDHCFYSKQPLDLKSPIYEKKKEMKENLKNSLWDIFKWNVPHGCSIILFGAGNRGKLLYHMNLVREHCKIVLWVDSNAKSLDLEDEEVRLPEEIKKHEYDKVVIANSNTDSINQIRSLLNDMGVSLEKILAVG